MGHKVVLESSYERYEEADFERFAEYQKAIPFLTIDDSARKQAELEKLRKETSNLQSAKESITQYKTQVNRLEDKVEKLYGILEGNGLSKIVYENNETNKKLLLESLDGHEILKLSDKKFIIGKKMPTKFRFE